MLGPERPAFGRIPHHQFKAAYLQYKVPSSEVSDRTGQTRSAPDESEKEAALNVGKFLHHLPEPLDELRVTLHSFICRHLFEQNSTESYILVIAIFLHQGGNHWLTPNGVQNCVNIYQS